MDAGSDDADRRTGGRVCDCGRDVHGYAAEKEKEGMI